MSWQMGEDVASSRSCSPDARRRVASMSRTELLQATVSYAPTAIAAVATHGHSYQPCLLQLPCRCAACGETAWGALGLSRVCICLTCGVRVHRQCARSAAVPRCAARAEFLAHCVAHGHFKAPGAQQQKQQQQQRRRRRRESPNGKAAGVHSCSQSPITLTPRQSGKKGLSNGAAAAAAAAKDSEMVLYVKQEGGVLVLPGSPAAATNSLRNVGRLSVAGGVLGGVVGGPLGLLIGLKVGAVVGASEVAVGTLWRRAERRVSERRAAAAAAAAATAAAATAAAASAAAADAEEADDPFAAAAKAAAARAHGLPEHWHSQLLGGIGPVGSVAYEADVAIAVDMLLQDDAAPAHHLRAALCAAFLARHDSRGSVGGGGGGGGGAPTCISCNGCGSSSRGESSAGGGSGVGDGGVSSAGGDGKDGVRRGGGSAPIDVEPPPRFEKGFSFIEGSSSPQDCGPFVLLPSPSAAAASDDDDDPDAYEMARDMEDDEVDELARGGDDESDVFAAQPSPAASPARLHAPANASNSSSVGGGGSSGGGSSSGVIVAARSGSMNAVGSRGWESLGLEARALDVSASSLRRESWLDVGFGKDHAAAANAQQRAAEERALGASLVSERSVSGGGGGGGAATALNGGSAAQQERRAAAAVAGDADAAPPGWPSPDARTPLSPISRSSSAHAPRTPPPAALAIQTTTAPDAAAAAAVAPNSEHGDASLPPPDPFADALRVLDMIESAVLHACPSLRASAAAAADAKRAVAAAVDCAVLPLLFRALARSAHAASAAADAALRRRLCVLAPVAAAAPAADAAAAAALMSIAAAVTPLEKLGLLLRAVEALAAALGDDATADALLAAVARAVVVAAAGSSSSTAAAAAGGACNGCAAARRGGGVGSAAVNGRATAAAAAAANRSSSTEASATRDTTRPSTQRALTTEACCWHAEVALMERLAARHPEWLLGREGYALTTLEAALHILASPEMCEEAFGSLRASPPLPPPPVPFESFQMEGSMCGSWSVASASA